MGDKLRQTLKLNLLFTDRVGIVADISVRLAEQDLNIVSMEVVRKENKADVYLEVETFGNLPSRTVVFEQFGKIADLIELRLMETLPQEQRENRFRVVLDNISDWVISIDENRKITTVNRVAREILGRDTEALVGRDIRELNFPDTLILDCLSGKTYANVKKDLITEKGRYQFVAKGRPIMDSRGRIIGAVEIGKDMQEIKLLAQSLSKPSPTTFSDFISEMPVLSEAITFARRIAKTDSIVSIRGESGTGKELFAAALHTESGRSGPFVPINCAALPEHLLESELFGYTEGAFTGAKRGGKAGLFEIASSGTLFLDEIAEMPLSSQAKILRVIQERSVRRIGGTKEINVFTRILTATSRNLEQMVKDGQFRTDLYYRINVLPIHIPPLRERVEDIPILARHFLVELANTLNKPIQDLSSGASSKLTGHLWPGNVRELKNVIERAAWFSENQAIQSDNILFSYQLGTADSRQGMPMPPDIPSDIKSLSTLMGQYEQQIISQGLKSSKSIRGAARALNISHTALLNKIKKYKLQVER
ncbi:MAG: sigma 54-interacting transcriptional regulator [Deltaproteobacteria bacterium]|nr:sigma 54-interacting transcriptional regulator [Deltaproteobacteria bacterium]